MERSLHAGTFLSRRNDGHAGTVALGLAWQASTRRSTLLRSTDRDAAQAMVGKVFCPHRLRPRDGAQLAVEMQHQHGGLLGLSSLRYGDTVDIHPEPLERFYLLQIPLTGHAQIESGGNAFISDPECASLLSPAPLVRMRWLAGNEQLCLRIEVETVTRFLSAWCGKESAAAPQFDPRFSLTRHLHVLDLMQQLLVCTEHAQADQPGGVSLSLLNLQYQLLGTLLRGQAHDQHDLVDQRSPPVAPRSVRRVEEYLITHCEQPLTPESLAALVGVSVRSLFLGFQRYRGTTPMRLLRELRMQRARQDLLQAGEQTRVTDVALRWGFSHLGRFSQDYRESYGESPSETLRFVRCESVVAGTWRTDS